MTEQEYADYCASYLNNTQPTAAHDDAEFCVVCGSYLGASDGGWTGRLCSKCDE